MERKELLSQVEAMKKRDALKVSKGTHSWKELNDPHNTRVLRKNNKR